MTKLGKRSYRVHIVLVDFSSTWLMWFAIRKRSKNVKNYSLHKPVPIFCKVLKCGTLFFLFYASDLQICTLYLSLPVGLCWGSVGPNSGFSLCVVQSSSSL